MKLDILRIDEIVSKYNFVRNNLVNYPCWINRGTKEGIEYRDNELFSFGIVGGTKDYTHKDSTDMEKIKREITEDKLKEDIQPDSTAKNEKKDEQKEEDKQIQKNTCIESILPDFLTPALMSKWAKLSTTDRILMFQKTPKDQIYEVKVGKDEFGRDTYASYVKGNYMFKEANAAFLFDWYLEIKGKSASTTGVGVDGVLYCWFSEYNKYLSRPATGYQEINKKVDKELALKGATTDAIKKGLSLFGFNSDVYSGEV